MKAKRRHELKENDLAHALEQLGASFKDWGGYVIGGLAIVFVGVVIFTYMKTARETALDDSYAQMQKESNVAPAGVPKTNEELLRSLTRIGDLADQSNNDEFKVEARLLRAELALQTAVTSEGGVDKAFLDEAEKGFETLVRDYKNLPIYYGRALYGLFQVESNAFAVDGDASRKAAAEGHLLKLRDDSRLAGVPLQQLAVDRLNELDDIFTKVEFPSQPSNAIQSVISPTQPSTTITIGDSGDSPSDAPPDEQGETSDDGASNVETGDTGTGEDDAGDEAADSEADSEPAPVTDDQN